MVHKKLMEERWDVHKDDRGRVVKPCYGCDSLKMDEKDRTYYCGAGPLCGESIGIIGRNANVNKGDKYA